MAASSRPVTTAEPDRHEAVARLRHLDGPRDLQAAVLALLLPAGNRAAIDAWHAENPGVADAGALQARLADLPGPARLPWFECLLSRMRLQPLAARQDLLEAMRRLMAACGRVRPIDRLHWLEMRRRLGDPGNAPTRTRTAFGPTEWDDEATLAAIACYSAFLAQMMIPNGAEPPAPSAGTGPVLGPSARAWHAAAMATFGASGHATPAVPPDTDAMFHALQTLQLLPWMQQPVLVRNWHAAAVAHGRQGRPGDPGGLGDPAADALRLTASLLDSPLPPDLGRHFHALPDTAGRDAAGSGAQNRFGTR